MPIFSIYTPTYNGEKFIRKTLESVLSQSLTDFEWYIHDDGSSDSTFEILQEYAVLDNRIILERGKNKTSILAMNKFIDNASGRYIAFIDHDDLWSKDYLRNVYEHLNANPDVEMAITSYTFTDETGNILDWKTPNLKDNEILSKTELKKRFLTTLDIEGFRWNKFVATDILQNSGVRIEDKFPADIYMEYKLTSYINKAVLIDEKGYSYRQSPHSEVGTVNPENTKGMLAAFHTINEWARADGLAEEGKYYQSFGYIDVLYNSTKKNRLSKAQVSEILVEFPWNQEVGISTFGLFKLFSKYKNLRNGHLEFAIKTILVRIRILLMKK